MEKKIIVTIEVADETHCKRPSVAFYGDGCQFAHAGDCFLFGRLAKGADGRPLRHPDCLRAELKNDLEQSQTILDPIFRRWENFLKFPGPS